MRTLTGRQFGFDAALAALFALVCVALLYAIPLFSVGGRVLEAGPLLVIASALVFRRLAPGVSLLLAWIAAAIQLATGLSPAVYDLGICAVLYATGAYGGARVRWLGLASAIGGALIATAYLIGPRGWFGGSYFPTLYEGQLRDFTLLFVGTLALLVLSWVSGLLMRSIRAGRSARERADAAQREAELAESRVVLEQERNRIARDMHDVVAHSLAVVIAQADGARFAASTRPAVAVGALETISSVARDALGDVRMLLAELRHDEGSTPQPAVADLDALFAQLRAAGLELQVRESGSRVALGTGHEIAAYRIVQEGLTNALRHGAPARPVSLELRWGTDALEIELVNELEPAEATGPVPIPGRGHGLPGMHERAQLAGGVLSAGTDDGRFVLHAVVPGGVVS